MDETMLQRLARTMNEMTMAHDGAHDGAHGGASRSADDLLADTHRLLQAMREPTENMAIAGGEAVPGNEMALHSEVAKDVWRAMIEDALSGDDG